MRRDIKEICDLLGKELRKTDAPNYDDVRNAIEAKLKELARERVLALGEDYRLEEKPLEYRVCFLLEDMGLSVLDGRREMEDLLVYPSHHLSPRVPLVLEVKSSKKNDSPARRDLRELDDWVFELSGEETWRRRGLLAMQGKVPLHPMFQGAVPPKVGHPTPHKGVFIFNGPTNTPFDERRRLDWLRANEKKFAEKRSFCILSLQSLVSWSEACQKNAELLGVFWQKIHETCGVLNPYDECA